MREQLGIITIEVQQDRDGLLTATSPDLAGVFIAHRDEDKIIEDIPNIIRLWFQRNRNITVEVFQGPINRLDGSFSIPAIPVPVEIAAKALTR